MNPARLKLTSRWRIFFALLSLSLLCVFSVAGLIDLIQGEWTHALSQFALTLALGHWEDSLRIARIIIWFFSGRRQSGEFSPGEKVWILPVASEDNDSWTSDAGGRKLARVLHRPLVTDIQLCDDLHIPRFSAHPHAWVIEFQESGKRDVYLEDGLTRLSPLEQLADAAD